MTNAHDPNFPVGLQIKPLDISNQFMESGWSFDASAQKDAICKYGIAGRVWEAAFALKLYINPPPGWSFEPRFLDPHPDQSSRLFVELGSGSGVISHYISQATKHTRDTLLVTDLPEVCPLLEENLRGNSERLVIRPLSWGNAEEARQIHSELISGTDRFLTHIVCSDLVYFPELLSPLLRTLLQLSSPPFINPTFTTPQTIIISYKIRSFAKESVFWSAFGLWFSFYPVLYKARASSSWARTGSTEDIPFIFIAHRRPESSCWIVPNDDQSLLQGVGARGTSCPKSDDTFETLLLMSVDDDSDEDSS
ncbi:hypothetical protein PC9H_009760 [Pleurotus ostreatus]|uniref:Methyltransferase-domain-containing protein n=1 Tax=Pleurotus ostreatus TaxID=5322 RepID=A0A8H7DQZ2_PLEOS|nr:uncharacterized protein PC9H_009760 [Pleurotus ostreatus]KAF7424453.1 hypothetical protein PC9H_009760 [Pleurotus ostreatus]KAJ8692596.1 hypothetical protein PTI98_009894 [Pleurotus ostreatus]